MRLSRAACLIALAFVACKPRTFSESTVKDTSASGAPTKEMVVPKEIPPHVQEGLSPFLRLSKIGECSIQVSAEKNLITRVASDADAEKGATVAIGGYLRFKVKDGGGQEAVYDMPWYAPGVNGHAGELGNAKYSDLLKEGMELWVSSAPRGGVPMFQLSGFSHSMIYMTVKLNIAADGSATFEGESNNLPRTACSGETNLNKNAMEAMRTRAVRSIRGIAFDVPGASACPFVTIANDGDTITFSPRSGAAEGPVILKKDNDYSVIYKNLSRVLELRSGGLTWVLFDSAGKARSAALRNFECGDKELSKTELYPWLEMPRATGN